MNFGDGYADGYYYRGYYYHVRLVRGGQSFDSFALTLARSGNGAGRVTSAPAGINCGKDCTKSYASGTAVTLIAKAASGSRFNGWSGACSGTSATCTIKMTAARKVTATFNDAPVTFPLAVSKTGNGSVTSTPAGISCGKDCTKSYASGTAITLTAKAGSGYRFAGWSGACSGTKTTCTVTMTAARNAVASFEKISGDTYAVIVTKTGDGGGVVMSTPAGIFCGKTCRQTYPSDTQVVLTANAESDSHFIRWGGACSGNNATCVLTVDAPKTVTAIFRLFYRLEVKAIGPGKVTSSIPGIDCGITCNAPYVSGQKITLTARPDTGGVFAGWRGGGCSGKTPTCEVTMDVAKSVTATFTANYLLTVSKQGNGSGTVTSVPVGINCGTDCKESYPHGKLVTLTARPADGSIFNGWSVNCEPIDGKPRQCTLTLTSKQTVRVTFSSSKASDAPDQ